MLPTWPRVVVHRYVIEDAVDGGNQYEQGHCSGGDATPTSGQQRENGCHGQDDKRGPRDDLFQSMPVFYGGVNHPGFHAPSGFCEPAGRSVTCWE